jgi:predicted metal-dependent hydrolase
MSDFVLIYIGIIILFLVCMFIGNRNKDMEYIKSEVDETDYLVRTLPDKKKAANLLAKTKKKLLELSHYLEKTFPQDERVKRLSNFYNTVIVESQPKSKFTSFSINKGEKIVFCIRSRNSDEKLVNLNLLMFVAIHELAHVITSSIGHTEEFWDNFKWLLIQAVKIKIYKAHNFQKKPEEYCGTTITDSPLQD